MASAPSAARGAPAGLIANGNRTIDEASAIAIWAVTDSTDGPVRPSESMTGSARAADDENISTAYSGAWPVPNNRATATPNTAATAPTATARNSAFGKSPRSDLSRTGT